MRDKEYYKRRIYEIIEVSKEKDTASKAYDSMILVSVIVGLIPLTMKNENIYAKYIDVIVAITSIYFA